MESTASLEDCPVEIIDSISDFLEFEDCKQLRLTGRLLSSKASQGAFKYYCRTKHIKLDMASLQEFVEATNPGHLGCEIHDLVLVGLALDVDFLEKVVKEQRTWVTQRMGPSFVSQQQKCAADELEQAKNDLKLLHKMQHEIDQLRMYKTDVDLLAKAFANIAANSKAGRLRSLTLEVETYRKNTTGHAPKIDDDWMITWKAAASSFEVTMASLSRSALQIDVLRAFSTQQNCSLACDEFSRVLRRTPNLPTIIGELRDLSVSLSTKIMNDDAIRVAVETKNIQIPSQNEPGPRPTPEYILDIASDEDNYTGLATILASTPLLMALDIHWSAIGIYGRPDIKAAQHRREQALSLLTSRNIVLPSLVILHLRGVHTTAEDILNLLQNDSINQVQLQNVDLTSGNLQLVLDRCTSESLDLESLLLDDLFALELVLFDLEGYRHKFPLHRPRNGGRILHWDRDEIRRQKPIRYRLLDGRDVQGSQEAYAWRRERQEKYGPPGRRW